jgi:hypothetical protein
LSSGERTPSTRLFPAAHGWSPLIIQRQEAGSSGNKILIAHFIHPRVIYTCTHWVLQKELYSGIPNVVVSVTKTFTLKVRVTLRLIVSQSVSQHVLVSSPLDGLLKLVPNFADRGVPRSQRDIPTAVFSDFWTGTATFSSK